jgi:hypothetical protein
VLRVYFLCDGNVPGMAQRSPWWKLTRTPRQALLMSGGYAISGLCELLAALAFRGHGWQLAASVFFLAFSAIYLGSYLAQYRHSRTRAGDHLGPGSGSAG